MKKNVLNEISRLLCRLKLFQETDIVFREEAQIVDAVLQVGDTFDTHTEGIAAVYLAVNSVQFQYVGVTCFRSVNDTFLSTYRAST